MVAMPLPICYTALMKRHYNEYTDKDIAAAVPQVNSMAGLLKKLGLRPAGGNYISIKAKLQKLNLDCKHWTGNAWSRGQQLKTWKGYSKIGSIKPHLIKLRGHKCETCNLTTWQNKHIALEVHHQDGDRTNNDLSNLKLLCPNCHSYTDFYRNRK